MQDSVGVLDRVTDLSDVVVVAGLGGLAVAILLCAVRLVRGPTLFDRVLAFDCMTLYVAGAALLLSILLETGLFMDVVLVVALLGFLGTLAFAAYLEGTLVE